MKKTASFVFFFIIVISLVYAQDDYADLSLKLDEKGIVYFKGTSNYAPFKEVQSEYFTSKKGPYWLLNITTTEKFSDYYISVEFPKNTEINYIKTSGGFRIAETPSLLLIASGRNEPIEIIVQYRIKSANEFNLQNFAILSSIILLTLLIILFVVRAAKKYSTQKKPTDKLKLIQNTLTDNQKLILDILHQAKEPITQKQIQHRTNLPKATLSRNLEILRQKNIITKQSRGMVNVVFINPEFEK